MAQMTCLASFGPVSVVSTLYHSNGTYFEDKSYKIFVSVLKYTKRKGKKLT